MIKPFSTVGIGSLPHRDAKEACRLVFDKFDIPFWPQLPQISFLEWMIPQYSEGMPFVRLNPEVQAIRIERDAGDELERFYESYTEGGRIAMSEDYARGLHAFLRLLGGRYGILKGHITGPLTFSLGLKDKEGRPAYFDDEMREISLMILKAKAAWQVDVLKQFADDAIIFVDEPILSALGSTSYMGVRTEEAKRLLTEIALSVKEAGGIPGIHCCGNADWPMVLESGFSILNFDAYGYFDQLFIYHNELKDFLEQGGYIAWGIVPTLDPDLIKNATLDSLREKLEGNIDALSSKMSSSLVLRSSILTPSCGTGSRSLDEVAKIFQLLMRLKELFA